jgi:preprotein translocase subunit SecB
MAEENQPAADQQQFEGLMINAQYLRDFSFENPNAPASLGNAGKQPDINVDVNVASRQLAERSHEVVLKISATAKREDQTAFIVEVEYGAVATLGKDIPETGIQIALLVEVPRIIFPYARKVLADGTQEGGFPPLLINPIDFRALLLQKQAQAQAAKGSETVN